MKNIFSMIGIVLLVTNLLSCQDKSQNELVREVSFLADDSLQVFGDLYQIEKDAPWVILFHQARSNARGEYRTIIPKLLKQGYNVFSIDQRSGGQLFGSYNRTVANIDLNRPKYCDAYPDLEAALDYLIKTGYSGQKLVWGSSYSAALVIKLAAEHPQDIDGVLAFSPASGEAMGACTPNGYFESLQAPLLVLRPESEMEYESVIEQLELAKQYGLQVYIAKDGVHGSSMLVAERTKANVDQTWEVVLSFIEKVSSN